jgi:N-formylglutamate deformylase
VLIDCHSMPGNIRVSGSGLRPDFIIGDRYGTSASGELSRTAMRLLEDMGFSVVRNKPYAGGFITEHYGRPAKGLHALQIEVNRGLYVDETTLAKKPDFAVLQTAIAAFLQDFSDHVEDYAADRALAAE